MDLASLYGVPGLSKSVSSSSPFDFFGVVWGVVVGVVLSGILPAFLLLVESFLVLVVDGCGSSEHAVCALVQRDGVSGTVLGCGCGCCCC